jgi:hypothetical protein
MNLAGRLVSWSGSLLLVTAALAAGPAASASASLPLLSTCSNVSDSADSFGYRMCSGFVPSFDGVPLDVDLTMPASTTPTGGYPLVVMMHGWGNSKTDWESADFCDSGSADRCNYNNVAFASRGYAVLNYTARGFHGSCGPGSPNAATAACATGWTHLADLRYEIHDTQYLAGLLVDAGVARPGIAVTGGSYGGGQSWLLALLANRVMSTNGTLAPWTSPNGIAMHIAAAVPKYPWTDLVDALTPNGRASDGILSRNGDRTTPFGIEKKSYVDYLYASGASSARYAAPGQDPTADLTTWYHEISLGENPAEGTYAPGIIDQITHFRSPYYQTGLISSDVAGHTETPVFDIQGWTDHLFPEVAGASMIEKLRATDPRWPAYLYASDLGHPPADNMKFSEWRVINAQAASFIDHYMKSGAGVLPRMVFQEQVVTCDASAGPVFGSLWLPAIAPGRVAFTSSESGHATASAPSDAAAGAATDPLAFYIGNGAHGGCIKLPGALPANGAMTSWTFPVCSTFTMVGEPALSVRASITGSDAEINSRLWDEAPDGSVTLVTRGMYRWNGASGAAAITYSMIGSAWTFASGHRLRIEVTQNDAPYMRLDNYPSTITYSSLTLTLPSRAAISC